MIFLQVSTDTILEINPYNAIGYGMMVLLLMYACVTLWRNLQRERTANIQNLKDTSGVLHQLSEYLKNEGLMEKLLSNHDVHIRARISEIKFLLDEQEKRNK
jgi:predicted membrane protein